MLWNYVKLSKIPQMGFAQASLRYAPHLQQKADIQLVSKELSHYSMLSLPLSKVLL